MYSFSRISNRSSSVMTLPYTLVSTWLVVSVAFVTVLPCAHAQAVQTLARLSAADGLAVDAQGSVFASRYAFPPALGTVFKITPEGEVSTFLTNQQGPADLTFDQEGDLYISMFNANAVRRVSPSGSVETIATGLRGPLGLTFDDADNLYVLNDLAPDIIRLSPGGGQERVATIPGLGYGSGLTRDGADNLYAVSYSSGDVYKITSAGEVSRFARTPAPGHGFIIFVNGMFYTTGIQDHTIYQISTSGEVGVLAGTGQAGYVDGPASTAQFQGPNGLTASATGDTLYVADANAIRMIIMATATGVEEQTTGPALQLDLGDAFPNPFQAATRIPVTLQSGRFIAIRLFDGQGRLVQTIYSGFMKAGRHEVSVQIPESLAPGAYIIRAQTGGASATQRIIRMR